MNNYIPKGKSELILRKSLYKRGNEDLDNIRKDLLKEYPGLVQKEIMKKGVKLMNSIGCLLEQVSGHIKKFDNPDYVPEEDNALLTLSEGTQFRIGLVSETRVRTFIFTDRKVTTTNYPRKKYGERNEQQ